MSAPFEQLCGKGTFQLREGLTRNLSRGTEPEEIF